MYVNDIRQHEHNADFFSASSAGLGYSSAPYVSGIDIDAKPEGMTTKQWVEICNRYERYLETHFDEIHQYDCDYPYYY